MKKRAEAIPIMVSARILRHISRGIYRTPAGALKELVSNAYDASATKVTINTGYPVFEKIVVTDNGTGMNKSEFKTVIGNIGLSDKVAGKKFNLPGSRVNRVTIGHYGIGLLAIGQLCRKVIITSKIKDSCEGFKATLDFEQFEVNKKDDIERSSIISERELEEKDKKVEDIKKRKNEKFSIGKCYIEDLHYDTKNKQASFTRLDLEQIRSEVQRKLSGNIIYEYKDKYKDIDMKKKYYSNFDKLLKLYREKEKHIRQGQYPYEKLCWELSSYSPIKYPDISIFKTKLNNFKNMSDKYRFELVIDGMEIHKPVEDILFNDEDYPVRNIFQWVNETYYKDEGLKVSGYLVYRQYIRPKSLQGVLLRDAGVAIGMFDTTFLEYPYHEGTKFEQLTGELFVEGLAGSLNIDRNSFNETDDYYLALVKWFHGKLHDEVFPTIQKHMKVTREDAVDAFMKVTKRYMKDSRVNYNVKFKNEGRDKPLFCKEGKTLFINKNHPQGKPKKSVIEKLCLASILVISGYISGKEMEKILTTLAKKSE